MHGFLKEIQVKNSLLSATSLASVTYTPSLALQARNPLPRTVRPLGIPVSTVGVLAASLAGLLTTYGAPATAAVIYSVDKSSLSFGNLLVGASSASQTVVITNQVNGTTTVAITAGTGVTTNISSTVLKKLTDTDPFNASVKAATRGALSSSITLSGTNPGITAGNPGSAGNPDVTPIPVTATGVAPMASVTATAVYVLVGSGSKASTTATVTNIGDGNLSGLGASSNLSAGTNTGVLGTGWAG